MVQEQRDLLQHGLARRPFLHDQHLRQFARVLLLWAAEAFSPVDHELHLGSCFGVGDPPEQLDRAHVAQGGAQEHAVEGRGAQRLEHPCSQAGRSNLYPRSEEHTSELQSQSNLVCRLLLEKKKQTNYPILSYLS